MTKLRKSQYCSSANILEISDLPKTLKLIIAASISQIFDVHVISPHITLITLKYVTNLRKSFILVDKILNITQNPY